MKPLLSIIIATKNRVPYCINTIETILSFSDNDFELIVQDNTDNLELCDFVNLNISDQRLIYNYTPPPFSSIDNFNAALELASGEYVCLIGDDDGICSTIFDVVKWAKANDVDSICPKVFVDYYWPGAFNPNSIGYLTIPFFSKNIYRKDPQKEIQHLIADGIINYMRFNLPKFYHGLVKKSCFEEIKAKNGFFIGGLSPDIYSAVSLSNIVKKHIILDFPITIAGACRVSTTVAGFTGGHSGKLKEAPHFRDRGNYVWDKQIPKYYSVTTIWAESALKAIHDNTILVDLDKLNLSRILAKSILDTPNNYKLFYAETSKITEKKLQFNLKLIYQIIRLFIHSYSGKVINKIKSKTFLKQSHFTDINNIGEASIKTNRILSHFNAKKILHDYDSEHLIL